MDNSKLETTIKGLISLAETELDNFDDRKAFLEGELHAYNKILTLLKPVHKGMDAIYYADF